MRAWKVFENGHGGRGGEERKESDALRKKGKRKETLGRAHLSASAEIGKGEGESGALD